MDWLDDWRADRILCGGVDELNYEVTTRSTDGGDATEPSACDGALILAIERESPTSAAPLACIEACCIGFMPDRPEPTSELGPELISVLSRTVTRVLRAAKLDPTAIEAVSLASASSQDRLYELEALAQLGIQPSVAVCPKDVFGDMMGASEALSIAALLAPLQVGTPLVALANDFQAGGTICTFVIRSPHRRQETA